MSGVSGSKSRQRRRTETFTDPGAALRQMYDLLYQHFGPRHWWPAETPFEVIVGAILTQSVAWRNVEKAIANLKQAGLLNPEAIYRASEEEVAELIRPARYFRAKARKLKAFIAHLMECYGGSLEAMFHRPLEELRPELLQIYGVGRETADAILLYAGRYPILVVDAYTARIMYRAGLWPRERLEYDRLQQFLMAHLPREEAFFNEFHALIDALGHRLCLSNRPRCGECPLKGRVCRWPERGGQEKEGKGGSDKNARGKC